MDISCPRCAAPVPATDVDLSQGLAKCRECQAVFDFRTQVAGFSGPRPTRAEVTMPKQMSWEQSMAGLSLVYRWYSPSAWAILLFTLFWDGFMVVWMSIAFTQGEWGMAAFGSIHASVGIFLAYWTLCKFKNRTTIAFLADRVTVRTTPFKFLMGKDVDVVVKDLDQVYCEEKITRNKNGVTYRYHVKAKLKGGENVTLVKDLEKPEQALYLEQEIERTLGIRDVAVPGEMAR